MGEILIKWEWEIFPNNDLNSETLREKMNKCDQPCPMVST